jgi:methionine synthase I (cobalamin-dependent)
MISSTEKALRDLLAQRILILDGAMGTMIQQYKLQELITAENALRIGKVRI